MRVALCTVLACATMACASSQTLSPPTNGVSATQATAPEEGEEIVAIEGAPVMASVSNKPWLGAAAGSEYVLTGGQDQFVGVWVEVPAATKRVHVPISLTLTIDTSGSMGGEKIVRAREAAKTLVQHLHDGDMVTIHAFSGSAFELIAPTVLNARTRLAVSNTISELSADGATNMQEALNLAIGRARSAPASHPVRRVVIISDGRATAGITSTDTLAQFAENGTQFGVQVTALGVGLDYDENTLNALAVRSSGRLYHLSDPNELVAIIKSELRLLQQTMAINAIVEVLPAPGVQLLGAGGVRAHWRHGNVLRIPLGTMFAGQRRELLVRYRLTGSKIEGSQPIVSARLHFADPTDGGVPRVQEVVVRGQLTNDASLVAAHQNEQVQAIIAMHEAATIASAARAQVSAGAFEDADLRLATAEQKLRSNAARAKSKRDQARMLSAAKNVARTRKSVRRAAKAPPKSRAKAARKSSLELNDMAMEAWGY